MEEKDFWKLPWHKKLKYFAKIIAIVGGLYLIYLNVGQLRLNEKQLKLSENQLKLNIDQLDILSDSLNLEISKGKAQLEVWQRRSAFQGSPDDRTIIYLLFRNLSHRPTAIIDVYIRSKGIIIEGRGYKGRIKLPIKIEPWGIEEVNFRIEKKDEQDMTDILIRDIEDNEIPLISKPGQTWTKTKSKK